MSRLIRIPLGIVLGHAMALLTLVILVVLDTTARQGGLDMIEALGGHWWAQATTPEGLEVSASPLDMVSMVTLAVSLAPLVLVALSGELAGLRGLFWYAVGTGLVAVLVPFMVRYALHLELDRPLSVVETHFLALFFIAGAAGGTMYALVAGHGDRAKTGGTLGT